ncbi:MAG: thiol reductant ABC exporter subunit CydD [Eggerthellaceae bacterium]|nr:thiol reductant ABC exporter subunit CydD [Eggerthellaceae bacterium]
MQLLDNQILEFDGSKRVLVLLIASGVADAAAIFGQAIGLASAITNVWYGAQIADQWLYLAIFLVCYVARQIIATARSSAMERFSQRIGTDLRRSLTEHAFDQGQAFVSRFGSGAVTTTLIEGVTQVENYLLLILPKVADLFAIPIALAVALFALDWVSGIIALAMLPFIMLYMRFLGLNAKMAAEAQHDRYEKMANHFSDTLRGISTLKFFGVSKSYAEKVYDISERFRKATIKTIRVATLSSLVIDLFRTFALAAIAIMLGFRLMDGSVALMPALAVLIIVPEFFGAVRRFSTDFHASLDGKNQLATIMVMLNSSSDNMPKMPKQATETLPWNMNSQLELCGIGLSHAEENDALHHVLTNVNARARGFARIGIVGASGAGKSTLAQMLAGFSDPECGSIKLNDRDVSTLHADEWCKHVAFIPQNPYIFHASLADNLRFYAPNATDEALARAIDAMQLGELINELPYGLDTVIGQGERPLSGGQAQRIALARAFLDESRTIVVFDEPTAHLDIETEYALKQPMLNLMHGKLVFFATHRLHWMADMDEIWVLDGGTIAEHGTLDELLTREGAYRKLSAQLRGGESV